MTESILIYILAGLVVILLGWVAYTEKRYRKLFAGTGAKDLESVMNTISKQIADVKTTQVHINKHLVEVDSRLDKSIRSIKTVRFNPFDDAGSNQSFAMAFLNDEGDGVIMSSLYARDRMSIFAKPIVNGTSDFELSTEEKEVLKEAK